jgi:hypothetical protein
MLHRVNASFFFNVGGSSIDRTCLDIEVGRVVEDRSDTLCLGLHIHFRDLSMFERIAIACGIVLKL